jgi:riboflavin kinase/FMN adenylyltransferase
MNTKCILDSLGYENILKGRIVKGLGRGKSLGFPTLNVRPYKIVSPKGCTAREMTPASSGNRYARSGGGPQFNILPGVSNGVYLVSCILRKKRYLGLANVGYNPTFKDKGFSVEVHLFDFDKEVKGGSIEVRFVRKLRPEMTFGSVRELVSQMRKDLRQAKKIIRDTSHFSK